MARIGKSGQTHPLSFRIVAVATVTLIAAYCLFPFLLLVAGSLTPEEDIYRNGYQLIPTRISLEAYAMVFQYPVHLIRAYGVSIVVTAAGTICGLFLTAMTGYVLSRREFRYRNHFSFYFYFTMLFSGGLVPFYILMVRYLDLKNNLLALILPYLLSAWFIILMKSFMRTIPEEIGESAKVDGANEFTIFLRLFLPLAKPALATIGLFIALDFWNDWFNSMLFIEERNLYSLQYYLHKILSNIQFARSAVFQSGAYNMPRMPEQSFRLAMTIVAIGPIVLLYPFVQKYFVKGLTIGAVKG